MTTRLNFDVIGDIHGEVNALHRLFAKLGYSRDDNGVYRHPSCKAIFVGDFIDRGPDQREVLSVVRKMIDADSAYAAMGNHELNAIAYATPDGRGGHFRPHTEKNRHQHASFLAQFGAGTADYLEAIAWFKTLPLWIELGGLRVIHACWHHASIQTLIRAGVVGSSGRVSDDGAWLQLMRHGGPEEKAIDVLLKGPELELPSGRSFRDKDGHVRRHVRQRWWDPDATSFRDAAVQMDDGLGELPDEPVPDTYFYGGEKPVIFGHYWMTGEPFIAHPRATCIDFSVAKSGLLVAYRWSGEDKLIAENLVHVPSVDSVSTSSRLRR